MPLRLGAGLPDLAGGLDVAASATAELLRGAFNLPGADAARFLPVLDADFFDG